MAKWIIIAAILAVMGYWFLGVFNKAKSDFLSILPIFTSSKAILIYWILGGIFYTTLIIILGIKIKNFLERKKRLAESLAREKEEVNKLLKIETDFLSLEASKELLDKLEDISQEDFPETIAKIEEVEGRIIEARKEERIWALDQRESELIESIQDKEHRLQERIESLEEETQKILERIDAFTTTAYTREELSQKEIKAVKTIGFTEENEFCVLEQKRINVLINPPGKQTVQHAFLVWSVQRLLEKNRKISRIISKDSVEADLTFEFEGKTFAIEIEVGSLLRKPEQMKEKIGSLNRKYSDRWIFLVSNKELYSKYNKFGLTTTRANFAKMLEKLLKTS